MSQFHVKQRENASGFLGAPLSSCDGEMSSLATSRMLPRVLRSDNQQFRFWGWDRGGFRVGTGDTPLGFKIRPSTV